ncbi:MAG: MFS transporter [Phycisphaerales bacterium]
MPNPTPRRRSRATRTGREQEPHSRLISQRSRRSAPAHTGSLPALVANAAIFTAIALEHQVIVQDAGHGPEVAARLIPLAGLVAMLAVPISGMLVDRFRERILLACTTVLLGLSCTCVAFASALPALYGAMVLMGMTQSLIFVLASPIFARYFGRKHHGAIRGTLTRSMIIGTAVGPVLLSLGAKFSDGYRLPLLACAADHPADRCGPLDEAAGASRVHELRPRSHRLQQSAPN